ncbi:MAG: response regulator [Bdellovibrionota bacterium]|nr:response regulator [Bdellovibrionota bacterium]
MFDEEMVEEFKIEAFELLDEGEANLLAIDRGEDFLSQYNNVFRVFHSLKGGAGMLGMEEVQKHTHYLENLLEKCKEAGQMTKPYIDYFLSGIDGSRHLLNGESIDFDYTDPGEGAAAVSVDREEIQKRVNKAQSSKGLVYIVDDEEDIREILGDLVDDAGFSYREFEDGQLAFQALKEAQDQPVCVLLDMTMPRMSGLDLLREIQKINPDLPVIFISGNLSKSDVIDSISYGVFSVLEKPFQPAHVIANLNNAAQKYLTTKLINRSIKFMFYQFSDLDDFLKSQGKEEIREVMRTEMESLITLKNELKNLGKAGKS